MLAIGSEIEGYRIERLLGRGGMGEVYQATQLGLSRPVAFKVVYTELGHDEAFLERFRREGRLQASLDHPHVVTVFEAGEIEQGLFLAMRLVDGSTLKQLIVGRELDATRTLRLLGPVADALDTAHGVGLVHRDVKPQNILIGKNDHPYLADFGLVRTEEASALTRSGYFVGTIDYAAPEQIRAEPSGPPSDIYALTTVLYECLTGSVPFPRPSDAAVLFAHVSEPPPRVLERRPDLPEEIEEVIAAGMAKDPEERPESASELIARASSVLEADPEVARSRPPAPESALSRGVRPVSGETEDDATAPPAPRPTVKPPPRRRPDTPTTTPTARRTRAKVLPAVAALGIALLAVAAFAAGRTGEKDGVPDELSTLASNGTLELHAPTAWETAGEDDVPEIPGLTFRNPVGLVDTSLPSTGVVMGMAPSTGPSLLSTRLSGNVSGELPAPTAVELGDDELQALRYRGVEVSRSDRTLTIYAAPTSGGVATVVCYAPDTGAAAFEAECEKVARTINLLRGEPRPLAPDSEEAAAATSAVAGLNKALRSGRRRLREAKRPDGQAAAAADLGDSYRSAARRLSKLELGALASEHASAAVGRLGAAADEYGRLAAAAGAANRGRYNRARAAVLAAERRAAAALKALSAGLEAPG